MEQLSTTTLSRPEKMAVMVGTILFLVCGALSAHWTRPFVAPDERPHYNYARTIATTGRLPILTTNPTTALSHQPPLAYAAFAGVYQFVRQSPLATQVFVLRLWSLVISSLVVYLSARLAKRLFPHSPVIVLTAIAVTALTPQFFYMSALVNNDGLTNLIGAGVMVLLAEVALAERVSRRQQMWAAVVMAAALLTKAVLWPLILVLGGVLIWRMFGHWRKLLTIGLPVIAAAGLWFTRNLVLYHDLTGLSEVTAQNYSAQHRDFLTISGMWGWLRSFVDSAWARFGYFNLALSAWVYRVTRAFALLAMLGAMLGLWQKWRTFEPRRRVALMLLGLCVAIIFIGTFIYSLTFYQPQGRYMFPVMSVLAMAVGLALEAILPKKLRPYGVAVLTIGLLFLDRRALSLIAHRG